MSDTTITTTEARKKIFDMVKDVQKSNKHFILSDKGSLKAVMMSYEEYESLLETLEVMKDFPNIENDIKEAEEQYKKGEYITLDELVVQSSYIVADTAPKKYAIQSSHNKKSPKRSKKSR